MDTLVCTASLLIIPINMAAMKGQYLIMNQALFLTLTSWAHHAICHTHTFQYDVYHLVDKIACYTSTIHLIILTLMYEIHLFWLFLIGVGVTFQYVKVNGNYSRRGLKNWHYHIPHIFMHLSALGGFVVVIRELPDLRLSN